MGSNITEMYMYLEESLYPKSIDSTNMTQIVEKCPCINWIPIWKEDLHVLFSENIEVSLKRILQMHVLHSTAFPLQQC